MNARSKRLRRFYPLCLALGAAAGFALPLPHQSPPACLAPACTTAVSPLEIRSPP